MALGLCIHASVLSGIFQHTFRKEKKEKFFSSWTPTENTMFAFIQQHPGQMSRKYLLTLFAPKHDDCYFEHQSYWKHDSCSTIIFEVKAQKAFNLKTPVALHCHASLNSNTHISKLFE